jgi:hypothetical protein
MKKKKESQFLANKMSTKEIEIKKKNPSLFEPSSQIYDLVIKSR